MRSCECGVEKMLRGVCYRSGKKLFVLCKNIIHDFSPVQKMYSVHRPVHNYPLLTTQPRNTLFDLLCSVFCTVSTAPIIIVTK